MDWSRISETIVSAYTAFATWCFENQTATDLIIGGVVLGSLLYLARHTLRMRRLTHRIRWGVGMKRSKNRDAFERGLISFAICDGIEEARWRGDMSDERCDHWYTSFATDYNMTELLPKKVKGEQLKQVINRRIQLWEKIKVVIPGLHPKDELKIDQTYQPTNVVPMPAEGKRSRVRSKYGNKEVA